MVSGKLAVGVFIPKGRRQLMIRRATGYLKGLWCPFGGTVEPREGFETTAIREVREESGIICQQLLLLGVTTTKREDGSDLRCVFFRAIKWMGDPRNLEPEKHDEMEWFQQSHPPRLLTPPTLMFIQKYPQLWAPSCEQLKALTEMQYGKTKLSSLMHDIYKGIK